MDKLYIKTCIFGLTLFSFSCRPQAEEKQNKSDTLSVTFNSNTTRGNIETYINNLSDSNQISFWAPTHPQLCDPGMDWTVKKENGTLKYQIWWHKPFSGWETITPDALVDTIYKYRDGFILDFRKRKL